MLRFNDLKVGDRFTNERKIKNNPHQPTVWQKKTTRTAMIASAWDEGKVIWFYFGKDDAVYKQ